MAIKLQKEQNALEIKGLKAGIDGKAVLKGVSLRIRESEVHALMGPNGSGKSTLGLVLAGHPKYSVEGDILLDGKSILSLEPEERAKKGLFLGFQHPIALEGVTVSNFLRTACRESGGDAASDFPKALADGMGRLGIPEGFASRYLNDGFSGGEKKRVEMLQMELLKPKFAVLDEIDSGLDVDGLKAVAEAVKAAVANGAGVLLITHTPRLLHHVKPDFVHLFTGGKITRTGGAGLAKEIERNGYGKK